MRFSIGKYSPDFVAVWFSAENQAEVWQLKQILSETKENKGCVTEYDDMNGDSGICLQVKVEK